MIFYLNKFFKILICFLLCFLIVFNFSFAPRAEVLTLSAFSIKVFVLLLGSMGLLSFVNDNGGVESFYNEFLSYMTTIKKVSDYSTILGTIVFNSIKNSVKMNISNTVSYIKDFISYKFPQSDIDLDTGIQSPRFSKQQSIEGKLNELRSGWIRVNSKEYILEEISISDNYSLRVVLYFTSVGANTNEFSSISFGIIHDGEYVSNTTISDSDIYIGKQDDMSTINIKYKFEINENRIGVAFLLSNLTSNKVISNSKVISNPGLVGVTNPDLDIPDLDIPDSFPVPYGLSFPWQLEIPDISGYIGQSIDRLIEGIADIPLSNWVETVLNLPKSTIDSIPVPEVNVNSEGIVVDVNVPDINVDIPGIDIPDFMPEIKKQTGLLQSIFDLFKDIFSIPDSIDLDFSPLKNLAITDKFPFSLPWDLKNSVSLLVAAPSPPRWDLPIVTEKIIIDFSQFDSLAKISRSFFSVIYVAGLVIITRRFIGGA